MNFKNIFNKSSQLKEPKSIETCAFQDGNKHAFVVYAKKQKDGSYKTQLERMRQTRIYIPGLLDFKTMACFSPEVQKTNLTLNQAVQELHKWEVSQDKNKKINDAEDRNISTERIKGGLKVSATNMAHYSFTAKKFDIKLDPSNKRSAQKFNI